MPIFTCWKRSRAESESWTIEPIEMYMTGDSRSESNHSAIWDGNFFPELWKFVNHIKVNYMHSGERKFSGRLLLHWWKLAKPSLKHWFFITYFQQHILYAKTIGVVAIGTLGTQALPNKERNLSIRNQKVFKYWAQYKEISSKFKWIVLNLGHQQLILLSSQYCTWNISNRNQEQEKVPSLENASTTPMVNYKKYSKQSWG